MGNIAVLETNHLADYFKNRCYDLFPSLAWLCDHYYLCNAFFFSGARSRGALPQLLNSEPNFVNEIVGDKPPSFYSRWEAIIRNFRILSSVVSLFNEVYSQDMRKTGKELTDYLVGFYDIIFVMDHPAFSFPYLSPPNTFYLGAYHLEDYRVSPLPDKYQEFLSKCPHKHVVLMSFGTYLEDITKFSKTMELLDSFKDNKLCIIVKSGLNLGNQLNLPSNQVLEEIWVPQKSLLHSGKINFFISHCGNNGRLESIYYNVPMLCIPLFGDQYHNARLVSRNDFGIYITRENLNKSTFISAVDAMIANEQAYKLNLRKAMDIARNDPGAGKRVLKFYSDLLIKHGSAHFLNNKIIMKQWYYEVVNLDVAALLIVVASSVAVLLILFLSKCVKCLFNKARKMKSE
jgi:glucuronosyltransferase